MNKSYRKSKVKTTTQKSKVEETVAVCERCESEVTKKELEQWFFRITKYADRLLNNIEKLDWSEKVKIAQRQWIGRSEGARIRFKIYDLRFKNEDIEVFTTRPDTLYGATFLVLAPEHRIVASLQSSKFIPTQSGQSSKLDEVRRYVDSAKKKIERERMAEGKEKTGVFSGLYAINPVNQEKLPIWIADYAVMGYGTGALFGDAHDKRDVEFAKKYKIPLKPTIMTGDRKIDKRIKNLEECCEGVGILFDSGEFSGLSSAEAKKRITAWLKEHKAGGPEITYHLRDWLISRQRYWGPPIPMIYCEKCDWQPVPEKDLPVLLPDVKDWKPTGTGKSPLATVESFVNTKCPNCNGSAKRETDVSDNFLDSSWYFLRYLATDMTYLPFPSKVFSEHSENSDGQKIRLSDKSDNLKIRPSESSEYSGIEKRLRWLPVAMYIGGAEHSVLHLLYSRFIWKVLCDLGYIDFSGEARPRSAWEEPFNRFYAHGLLIKEGGKMSKSKGNVVVPDEYINKFGADSLRMYLMFLGPFNQGGDFYDTGIEGMHRFLNRVYRLISEAMQIVADQNAEKRRSASMMHKTIKKVTEDISNLRYNTAIAALMEWYNYISKIKDQISKIEAENFLKLLAPFAPHMAEELWARVSRGERVPRVSRGKGVSPRGTRHTFTTRDTFSSIHLQSWPKYDPKFLEEDEVTIVVQVNGKVRETIKVESGKLKVESYVEKLARKSEKVIKYLQGKETKKVVYVEGKIINFVAE